MKEIRKGKSLEKKGFTLVELSAVIIILAVIALIAVPVIRNVIENFKEGALKNSAYGLVEAANVYYTKTLNKGLTEPITFDFVDDIQTTEEKLQFKGKINNGKVILNTNGNVVLCISDGKYYAYKELIEDKVTTGKGSCSYNGETGNFIIISDVDTLNKQIVDLQAQIDNAKNLLSEAITAKGEETSNSDSFEVMAENINKIKTGYVKELFYSAGTGPYTGDLISNNNSSKTYQVDLTDVKVIAVTGWGYQNNGLYAPIFKMWLDSDTSNVVGFGGPHNMEAVGYLDVSNVTGVHNLVVNNASGSAQWLSKIYFYK